MNTLRDRKNDLLLESEINRHILCLEFRQLQLRIGQARHTWLHGAWMWAAPVAGFLFARKLKRGTGLLAGGSLLTIVLRAAWDLWQLRRGTPAGD